MLEKLSVGKKIATGFGVFIALFVIATAISAYITLDRAKAFEGIRAMTTLQTKAVVAANMFNGLKAEADMIITNDSDADSERFIGQVQTLANTMQTAKDEAVAAQVDFPVNEIDFAIKNLLNWQDFVLGAQPYWDMEGIQISYDVYMSEFSSRMQSLSLAIEQSLLRLIDESISTSTRALLMTYALAVTSVLVGVLLTVRIAKAIAKPLKNISTLITNVNRTGDMSLTKEEKTNMERDALSSDEVGQSVAAFRDMLERLIGISEGLAQIAEQNLTVQVTPLSSQDLMGLSLQKMCENLNKVIVEIKASAYAVSQGAAGVALSSQDLAQHVSEQAHNVQELEAVMEEMEVNTQESLEKANSAAKHGDNILSAAQVGKENMEQMMLAVKEIYSANQSISKVIKAIDEIAFQTNILALNAAVEAARAGKHGKGFAVVAEEVRNLATKSAEAARDTVQMVSLSAQKTKQGLLISEHTAESLKEIIDGVIKGTSHIGEISKAMQMQFDSIKQINIGIKQVADVVNHNSIISDEMAISSEKMRSQAEQLHELITRFHIHDDDTDPTPDDLEKVNKYSLDESSGFMMPISAF